VAVSQGDNLPLRCCVRWRIIAGIRSYFLATCRSDMR